MKVIDLKETCSGCPTIFEWKTKGGKNTYFLLRHGYARIAKEEKILVEGNMNGFDGVCCWWDVKKWAKKKRLKLNDKNC